MVQWPHGGFQTFCHSFYIRLAKIERSEHIQPFRLKPLRRSRRRLGSTTKSWQSSGRVAATSSVVGTASAVLCARLLGSPCLFTEEETLMCFNLLPAVALTSGFTFRLGTLFWLLFKSEFIDQDISRKYLLAPAHLLFFRTWWRSSTWFYF